MAALRWHLLPAVAFAAQVAVALPAVGAPPGQAHGASGGSADAENSRGAGDGALPLLSARYADCWADIGAGTSRERCCQGGEDAGPGCFDELYTRAECCATGRAMLLPEARITPPGGAAAAEQEDFEREHAIASVDVSGRVLGHEVLLHCFKRSQATCRGLLKQAARDEFSLEDAGELGQERDATVVYVGASYGALLIGLARRFPRARFVAVEPEPAVFRYLAWNVRENGLAGRVAVRNAAVAEPGGPSTAELCVHYGRASRTAVCGQGPAHVEAVRSVPTLSLASLLPEGEAVDLLLLDCEGCEAKVLAGPAWRSLKPRVRRVAGELHYAAFPRGRGPPPGEEGGEEEEEDTALLSRGLDVAVALELEEVPSVPTRVGRRLWAAALGEHLPEPLGGGARPRGAEDFGGLRVFVYDLPPRFHADLLAEVGRANLDTAKHGGAASNCDFAAEPCTETSWAHFYSIVRQLASEVVVLQKLLRSPSLVRKAADADLFVVPYLHALDCRLTTWRFEKWARRCRYSDLPYQLWALLPHYGPLTAARHLFLSSIEPHNMHLTIASQPLLLSIGPRLGDAPGGHLVVPFLVTDAELQPSAWQAAARGEERPIEFLFTGSKGGLWRPMVVDQLLAYRASVGPERVLLGTFSRRNYKEAGVVLKGISGGEKRQALFCPCPPGDATSATVRFYDALLSGCVPVVIAFRGLGGSVSWFRNGGPPVEWSYAFPWAIRWRDAVVEVSEADLQAGRFVEAVHAVPRARLEQIRAYVASIRNRLVFDWAGSVPDAFTMLMGGVSASLRASLHASSHLGGAPTAEAVSPSSCTWLSGKGMPRAKYRWWSHAFGELYCFPEDSELPAFLRAESSSSGKLRKLIAGTFSANALQVVAGPTRHFEGACNDHRTVWRNGRVLWKQTWSALRDVRSASEQSGAPHLNRTSAMVYLYDGCANATVISGAALCQLGVCLVPLRVLVAKAGHGLIQRHFQKFKQAESRSSEDIRLLALQTATSFVDPPPGAAFWMHLLAALQHQHWRTFTYAFLNVTSLELKLEMSFLATCSAHLALGKVGACTLVTPLGHQPHRSPCDTVWRVASMTCNLPPLYDGAALAVVVLAPALLQLIPETTVRSLAMLATARMAKYEAFADSDAADLLLWLAHMPAPNGHDSEMPGVLTMRAP